MKIKYNAPRLIEMSDIVYGQYSCGNGTGVNCLIGCASGDHPGVDYPGQGWIPLGCGTGFNPA